MFWEKRMNQSAGDGIKLADKYAAIKKYPHGIEDYYHKNNGPWPQPAPDNPVRQMAEVIHLPAEEEEDWKENVGKMYFWRVVLNWPKGIWYALTHSKYIDLTDQQFKKEITEGLYSKFMTPLDVGDLELFRKQLPELSRNEDDFVKADFSCMEPIGPNCREGMYAAPTITLISKNMNDNGSFHYEPIAIYLYQVSEGEGEIPNEFRYKKQQEDIFTPTNGENWHLAKYFVLQGGVHRVNLTEHALLHFPFDCINAISKSILPTNHLLFQLLIPHFRLSLGVNRAVLENPGSLINRDQHKFYSPFCAEGIHVRKLLPDGYVGRGEAKKNAYPEYNFPLQPKIPDSDFGKYLQAYYDVFVEFVPKVLSKIDDDDEESWLYIGLWADCIEEWMPGFPKSENLIDAKNGNRPKENAHQLLNEIVTMIMWDLSIAHSTDHIAINNKRPDGNPFRLRVPIPTQKTKPDKNWRSKLVTRLDLLTFWFTDLLFYQPHNVTSLQNVDYSFVLADGVRDKEEKQHYLKQETKNFRKALSECEQKLIDDGVDLPARLDQISTSLQY